MKNSKKSFLFLPLVALASYTVGAAFLTFAPEDVMLSPGDSTLPFVNFVVFSVILLGICFAVFLGAVFFRKNVKGSK